MATNDVPGANPANRDKLSRGCWGEHEDGSLIYVVDLDENDRCVFTMYDLKDPKVPVHWTSALSLKDFETTFSYDKAKVNSLNLKWLWHNRIPFPWDKIMRLIDNPVPALANVEDTISAAERVRDSLQVRVKEVLDEEHLLAAQGLESRSGDKTSRSVFKRLKDAMSAFAD